MRLSVSCSGQVTEVEYGSIVVWKCVGVGSGHDKRDVVVYRLTEGVGFLLTHDPWLGIVLCASHRTGVNYKFVLF